MIAAVIYFFVALSESALKSPLTDEPPHIASGLSYVATGVFRGNLQHPPLLKELSGLSLLVGGIRWPRNKETESFLRGDFPKGQQPEWGIGEQIIARNGPDRTLFWARLPFLLISSLAGILVYFWGRELVGDLGAICATFLYFTTPTILGQAFSVTMDVGLTAFTVLFFFALWRYVQKPAPGRLLLCGISLGLVLCTKFSALLLLPAAGLLLLAAVLWPPKIAPERKRTILDPYYSDAHDNLALLRSFQTAGRNDICPCGSGKKYKACHADASSPSVWLCKRWALATMALLTMCVIATIVIEALYFFPSDPLLYLHGARLVNADHVANYPTYLAGELKPPRVFSYFAIVYLLKEPLASILLALAGFALLLRSKTITLIGKLFLLVPPVIFFVGTSLLADALGIRYIMPVLPFAYLLAGLALVKLFTIVKKWGRWIAVACCLWLGAAVVGIYPDHLSYFNESACLFRDPAQIGIDGGSKCGPLWLDESNVDYGQTLKQLKIWLDSHHQNQTVRLANPLGFPAEAYGIANVEPEILELARHPLPGLYAVSARLIARIPAVPGTRDWLRRTPPTAIVGHALYVFDTTHTP